MTTHEQIRETVVDALKHVAPELDPSTLDGGADLREALDIDSMDFLKFVVDLHARLHVDVPERDYRKLRTLDACVAYLEAQVVKA